LTGAGRRALVTGASSGIGAATARLLAAQGYRVALLARRADRLAQLARELPREGEHLQLVCDLTDGAALAAAVARAGDTFGALDLVVNNAGIGYRARVADLEDGPLRQLIATNLTAPLLVCRETLPHLRRGTRPVMVLMSSVLGRRGYPTQAAYAATKAGLCSLGESLRVEWASLGIEVCTLNPRTTRTEILAAQHNPAGLPEPDSSGAMDAEQVARAVLELDRRPVPEVFLGSLWRLLALASLIAPRLADRLLVSRAGRSRESEGW
jgi:NAD(P)-dependent dehydrogenase (short-subunit alcohol dehydrogenase family)